MTEQEARDDKREALIRDLTADDAWRAIVEMNAPTLAAILHAAGYRKHPEPEITDDALAEARAAVAELDAAHAADPYSTNRSWDAIKRCVRALRAVAGRVPVGEGERGCPYCEEVRRMDATYGSQIGVCIKHRTQPVPPAAPDWMPRIGGEPA